MGANLIKHPNGVYIYIYIVNFVIFCSDNYIHRLLYLRLLDILQYLLCFSDHSDLLYQLKLKYGTTLHCSSKLVSVTAPVSYAVKCPVRVYGFSKTRPLAYRLRHERLLLARQLPLHSQHGSSLNGDDDSDDNDEEKWG